MLKISSLLYPTGAALTAPSFWEIIHCSKPRITKGKTGFNFNSEAIRGRGFFTEEAKWDDSNSQTARKNKELGCNNLVFYCQGDDETFLTFPLKITLSAICVHMLRNLIQFK